jgi:hypothetical protein
MAFIDNATFEMRQLNRTFFCIAKTGSAEA